MDAPCTFPAGLDVAIGCARNAPHVDAGVPVEIFVLDRDQGVTQDGREIVIAGNHSPLQSEGTDDASLIVVEFGSRAGPVMFELFHLRKIGRVDQQQAGSSADQAGEQHQQRE